jgi:tetratricopeptide (TPR) repeat protein
MTSTDLQQKLMRAFALHQAGQLVEAEPLYKEILHTAPGHFDALHLLGVIHLQNTRHEEALDLIDRAIRINPHAAVALHNHGNVLRAMGRYQDALSSYDRALQAKPDNDEAHKNRGDVLQALDRHAEALACYAEALRINPNHAIALSNRGDALRILERYEEALASYHQALAIAPTLMDALANSGGTLRALHRYGEALQTYDKVLTLAPDHFKSLNNRGAVLRDLQRYPEALASLDKALALKPDYVEALVNKGMVLHELGREAEAIASYDAALALNPSHPESHWNKALSLLTIGKLGDAWADFEWRWQCAHFKFPPRGFTQPQWDGAPVVNGKLMVWGEQGIGDEVLYSGMVKDLVERGFDLIWEADPRLVPLIQRSYPGVRAIARTTPPHSLASDPAIHAQIPTASMGQYLRREPSDFPAGRPAYFKADEKRANGYRTQLLAKGQTRLIGVSWISKNPDFGTHKSSALADWAPLWTAAGSHTEFVDLQYGDTAAERAASSLPLAHLENLDLFHDIDGLAALIRACDLVITVSNTTAHLAGALGVPVLVLVPAGNGKLWYWGGGHGTSPWYPSATIFKQSAAGAWDDIARVARRLSDMP